MAVRPVLRLGDPRLLEPARLVEAVDWRALPELLDDLRETMAAQGGAGLAAPQIGVPWRVVLFGFESSPRYPEAGPIPETVLINPVIEPLGSDFENDWEGCLSVPGLRGWVPRHRAIRYRGLDIDGAVLVREVEGFHARLVQHECDHLDGILYPFRIRDLKKFGFTDVLFPADQGDASA